MQSKYPFSFVLIMRNEEKTIPRFLASIKTFLDNGGECVIVDTGSTDDSAVIARSLGATVHEVGDRFRVKIGKKEAKEINEKFVVKGEKPIVKAGDSLFDFASARNFASSLAENDFVFSPDCDEIFTAFDYEKVSTLIKWGIEQFEYQFVFSHDANGNPAIQFMHSKAFDRRKLKWTGVVHEVLQGEAVRQYVGENIIKLEHYQNESTNRSGYLKGLALDCFLHPENDRNAHYLGRELLWTWRPKSAVEQFRRHLAIGTWAPERSQSIIHSGEACEMLGDFDNAVTCYFEAYMEESGRREPLIKLAELFLRTGDWKRAIAFAEASLTIPLGNFYANNTENYTHRPHRILYMAYHRLGEMSKAKEHFDKAFAYQPFDSQYLHDIRFYRNLPTVSIIIPTLGRPEGLARVLESIDKLNYPKELIETIVLEDEPRIGVPKRVKEGFEKSTGEFIVYGSNDIEFTSDSIIVAIVQFADPYANLVSFNTWPLYPDEGNICEHFAIRRTFVENELDGEIFDTDFHHVWVDNLLWAKANKYGTDFRCAFRCEEAIVKHHHFAQTGKPMDDVYELAYSHAEDDRALLAKKLRELFEE